MSKERTREMNALRKTLRKEYKTLSLHVFWNTNMDKGVFSLLDRRMSTVGIRSYFIFKIFNYIKQQASLEGISLRPDLSTHLFEVQLPFLAEALITHAYYHNQILDGKGGVITHDQINDNLTAGNLLRSFIHRYVRSLDASADDLWFAMERVEQIMECVDLAQRMDKQWGTYQSFLEGVPRDTQFAPDFEALFQYADFESLEQKIIEFGLPAQHLPFTSLYLQRAFLANAALFIRLAEVVMQLMGYMGPGKEGILRFAGNYGLLVQIVNDNIDFMPAETVDKNLQDAFADLKNGTMSLPLILFFAQNSDHTLAGLRKILQRSPKKVFHLLLPTIVEQAMPISNWCAQQLEKFPDKTNVAHSLLADMASLGWENKYYYFYTEQYAQRSVRLKSKKVD